MKSRQNRWNGGVVAREDYPEGNNLISTSQYYTRNVGCYSEGFTTAPFVRPSAWRSLPGMTQGNQILAGVYAIYDNDSNFVAFTCRGAYQVDWGDGTSNTYADNTTAQKLYNRTTYAGLTSDVYNNYKNLVITITPQAGQTLTSINLRVKNTQAGLYNYVPQWVDLKIAAPSLSTLTIGTDNADLATALQFRMLKQFEFVGTNSLTSTATLFGYAVNLEKIVSLDTSNSTDFYRMHWLTGNLKEMPFYNTQNVTRFESAFSGVFKKIYPFNTSKATNLSGMFGGLPFLTEAPALDTRVATTMSSMFANCRDLKTIPWMDTRNVTDMSAMFSGCRSLKKIPFLNTSNVTNMSQMFRDCFSLTEIPPLDFSKVTNLSIAFAGCASLEKLPYLNTTTALTNLSQLFYSAAGGVRIKEISFADTSNVTNFFLAFWECRNLQRINGLNTSKATNMQEMFSACISLEEMPPLQFDSLVDATAIFWSTGVRKFGNTFFSFPKATNISRLFQSSGNIESIPPIDAPLALNVNSMFSGCANLTNVAGLTIASGVSLASFNTTGFNTMFSGCQSLNTIPKLNLDGLSAAAFTSIFTNMFASCINLSSLNGITGIGYNISVANAKLSATALNELYNGLSVVGASGSNTRTVTVSGNWGASAALGHLPSIAIAKGWQVTG